MKTKSLLAAASALAISATGLAAHEFNASLVVDGQTFVTHTEAPAHMENMDEIFSEWVYRTVETRFVQLDDFDNPGFVFVDQAIDIFAKVDGTEGKSCFSCHEDVAEFAGLRAQMPKVIDG